MIKDYLKQAPKLDKQINSKLEQIQQLRSLSEKITTTLSHSPKSRNQINRTEYCVLRIWELEQEIDREINKLIDLKKEIKKAIDNVKNDNYRMVLEYRYLCGFSWEDIAKAMNYAVRHITRLHGLALRELKTCPVLSTKNLI